MSSKPAAEAAIQRAARFMIAAAVELDAVRAAELHRVAAETMIEAAQLLSGHTGDTISGQCGPGRPG